MQAKRRTTRRRRSTPVARRWPFRRLQFEPLELRELLAVVTVNSTTDLADGTTTTIAALIAAPGNDGVISLREAITAANNTTNVGGPDEIDFSISGASVHTISPASTLPTITDPVIIDGYTQPGSSTNTLAVGDNAMLLIELNGAGAGTVDGLTITVGGSTVKGLVINGFARAGGASSDEAGGRGILLRTGGGNIIQGNFIGTDSTGTTAVRNDQAGVVVESSSNNLIGGTTAAARNLISGHSSNGTGIAIRAARFDVAGNNNIVQGNYIGTNSSGTSALGPQNEGVVLDGATDNSIGGTAPGAGNVISGHAGNGISINASGNSVQGNIIGLDASGANAVPNVTGVYTSNTFGNVIGGDDDDDGTLDGVVHARNVISGNTQVGVLLGYGITVALPNFVQGNFIGTDLTGTQAIGNNVGVSAGGEPGPNVIGGTTAGAGNVISGNATQGILIIDAQLQGTVIQGNLIGTKVDGVSPLGNLSHGILSTNDSITIGGSGTGEGNVIAFNGGAGVAIAACCGGSVGQANAILGNSIYSNVGLGIDLVGDGVTPNDPSDGDAGPNNLQNFPVLKAISASATQTTVQGTLNSTSGGTFRIELFGNVQPDDSCFGEGQTLLGTVTLTDGGAGDTDPTAGNIGFSLTVAGDLSGQYLSLTATNTATKDTSEFSLAYPVTSFVVTNTSNAGLGSLRQAMTCTNLTPNIDRTGDNVADPDAITFAIPGASVQTINVASSLPTITDPVIIDGYSQPGASANTLAIGNDAVLQIELKGPGTTGFINGLTITAGNSTVRGLVINNFGLSGLVLKTGGGNTVKGNFIGSNAAGTLAVINQGGIYLDNSPGNTIGGTAPEARNLLLGDSNPAIFTNLSSDTGGGNTIQGNYIGSNAAGTAVLAKTGILLANQNNLIGGTAAGARNVISTQGRDAIFFYEGNADNNIVQGNYLGVTVDGNALLGNGGSGGVVIQRADGNQIGGITPGARNVIASGFNYGVSIRGGGGGALAQNNTVQGNYIGTNAAGTADISVGQNGSGVEISGGLNNTIGGTVPGAANVIAGFAYGVFINATDLPVSTGNMVQGNFIGTNAAGMAALGNGFGVRIGGNPGANNNTIGGTAAGAGNVIAGNTGDGIVIASGTGNLIQGNLIGLAPDGTTARGNAGDGVEIGGGNNNTVGGTASGAANTIAFNSGDGVFVSFGTGNAILTNSIHSNTGLGIDLGANGLTANDANDPDTGPNNLQNFPEIASATVASGMLTIQYIVPSDTANSAYPLRVEFFTADADAEEGHTFLGFDTYLAVEANTSKSFMFTPVAAITVGDKIVGTATDNNGNTSEFTASASTVQSSACSLVVINTNDSGAGSLREAINCANNTPGLDTISFDISVAVVHTIQPLSALPTITDAVMIDGTSEPGFDTVPVIEIDGNFAGPLADGLHLDGNNNVGSTIRGLVINNFAKAGIRIERGGGHSIVGNYIGTEPDGTTAAGNRFGLHISTPNNIIGGSTVADRNVISANNRGILLNGAVATDNVVQGNYIGLNADGNGQLGNNTDGVKARGASGNMIGGSARGEGNVISSNNIGVNLEFGASDNVVLGNLIGTNPNGDAALGNGVGVQLLDAANNRIGGSRLAGEGNVIAGSTWQGLRINKLGATDNVIEGNLIGTDITGMSALGSGLDGVQIRSSGNIIGSTDPDRGNVISGSGNNGVRLINAGAHSNMVLGNLIGTDITGATPLGNSRAGVLIKFAPDNQIGGTSSGAGNVISGNIEVGVRITGSGAAGNVLEGNRIGVNATATARLGNGHGVQVDAGNNRIGGTTSGAGNVIGGNAAAGIKITGGMTIAQGNFIGTDAVTQTINLGNTNDGIIVNGGVATIGGADPGAGNVIANNGMNGVRICTGTGNAVRGNSIHDNAELGIDLKPSNGSTDNDYDTGSGDDDDIGANNLQNFPEITTAILDGANLDITYSIPTTTTNSAFPITVEFFLADGDGEEGEIYLGSHTYTSIGSVTADDIPGGGATAGTKILATATDNNGNTSEFSAVAVVSESLQAAGGGADGGAAQALTRATLMPIVDAAIDRLVAAGISANLFSTLAVAIGDLPGAALGLATGNVITLDVDAAGHGWFIDDSPLDDVEFNGRAGIESQQSILNARRHIDLLTAVMHELGHAAGMPDLDDPGAESDVMFDSLESGVRKTSLAASLADEAFAGF